MMQKTVNVEAKVGLKSSTIVRDSDIRSSRGHRPSNSTVLKVQTQKTHAKNSSRLEEPKAKEIEFVRADTAKLLEQDKKDKKDRRNKKRRFRKRNEQSDTLAIGKNTIDASKKKKKNRDWHTSRIIYYNCNKKGHFANTCIKPKN